MDASSIDEKSKHQLMHILEEKKCWERFWTIFLLFFLVFYFASFMGLFFALSCFFFVCFIHCLMQISLAIDKTVFSYQQWFLFFLSLLIFVRMVLCILLYFVFVCVVYVNAFVRITFLFFFATTTHLPLSFHLPEKKKMNEKNASKKMVKMKIWINVCTWHSTDTLRTDVFPSIRFWFFFSFYFYFCCLFCFLRYFYKRLISIVGFFWNVQIHQKVNLAKVYAKDLSHKQQLFWNEPKIMKRCRFVFIWWSTDHLRDRRSKTVEKTKEQQIATSELNRRLLFSIDEDSNFLSTIRLALSAGPLRCNPEKKPAVIKMREDICSTVHLSRNQQKEKKNGFAIFRHPYCDFQCSRNFNISSTSKKFNTSQWMHERSSKITSIPYWFNSFIDLCHKHISSSSAEAAAGTEVTTAIQPFTLLTSDENQNYNNW